MRKYFEHATVATIGETDVTESVYFAHFFSIQGTTRELWVRNAVPRSEKLLRDGLLLITRSANCEFHRRFRLFDAIVCRMQIRHLRKASAELVFRFHHGVTDELHAEGTQVVAFADTSGRLCRMPDEFRATALEYLESAEQEAMPMLSSSG